MKIISRQEALKQGLPRYFTGKPCIHGHVCERQTIHRRCCKCNVRKVSAYSKKNIEKCRAWQKGYYNRNKEEILKTLAKKRPLFAERIKRHYENNKVRILARNTEWRLINKPIVKARDLRRRSREMCSKEENISKSDIDELMDRQGGKCGICLYPIESDFHVDHIMPLALGGSGALRNLQVAHPSCNLSKGAKHPIDFMRSRGFLL